MIVVVDGGVSPRSNLKQMGMGSIHNFPDLGKITSTDGDSPPDNCQSPTAALVLAQVYVISLLPAVSPQAACAVGPDDNGAEDKAGAHPSWGGGTLRFLGIVPTQPYVTTESNCFFHI